MKSKDLVMISIIRSDSAEQIRSQNPQLIDSAAIDKRIDDHFPKDLPGGCSVVVMKEGEIFYKRSIGDHAEQGLDTPQHFASVSKEFTAACVVDLAKQGKIRLNQDIRELLPDLPEFTQDGKPVVITVDHLLQMQSGLPECTSISFLQGKDYQDLTMDESLMIFKSGEKLELFEKPGTQFKYCNTNYFLLNRVMKSRSGKDLKTYAQEFLFKPLGMDSTGYIDQNSRFVPGYSGNAETTTRNRTWGPCGIVGTAADMVKWDAHLSKSNLRDSLIEHPGDSIYGRGLFVMEDNENRYINHSGGIEGYETIYSRVESLKDNSQKFSVFIAANQTINTSSLASSIVNLLLKEEDQIAPEIPLPKVSYDISEMETRSGSYRCDKIQATHQLEVVNHNGKPALKMAPIYAANPAMSAIYFAPLADDPSKYVEIPGCAELAFNQDGFTYIDPNGCIKLEFQENRSNYNPPSTLPLGHAIL